MKKYLYLFLVISLVSLACGEKEKPQDDTANEDIDTTQLTKGVLFSAIMLNDYLQLEEDEDLGVYLENEVYPIIAGSQKVSMERITPSVYSVLYDSAGQTKNLIIERFYNPKEERVFFVKSAAENEPEEETQNK